VIRAVGFVALLAPFDQRRFGLFDPAGVWIDVAEHIESVPGWWDQYVVPDLKTDPR
jgi:hypothetical protein